MVPFPPPPPCMIPTHLLLQLREAGEDRGVLRCTGHDVRDETASPEAAAAAATITAAAVAAAAVTTVAAEVKIALPGRHDGPDDGPWRRNTRGGKGGRGRCCGKE